LNVPLTLFCNRFRPLILHSIHVSPCLTVSDRFMSVFGRLISVFGRFMTFFCVYGRLLSFKFIIISRKCITNILNFSLKKVTNYSGSFVFETWTWTCRERFRLFVPKRYWVTTRKFLGVPNRSPLPWPFLTVTMTVPDRSWSFLNVPDRL
jgi:hypothetical protein